MMRSVGRPTRRAVRELPPTTRIAKPEALKLSQAPQAKQSTTPMTRPQCTSPSQDAMAASPMMGPMRRLSASGWVDGLFRLAGSRIGPSTKCLNSAMAM